LLRRGLSGNWRVVLKNVFVFPATFPTKPNRVEQFGSEIGVRCARRRRVAIVLLRLANFVIRLSLQWTYFVPRVVITGQ
ncbi:hypothetical protein CLOM_g13731, partial [Closterium sp. NIES-68]